MVTTRKNRTGGRSGVLINKLDDSNAGIEDWFDSARSPDAETKPKAAPPEEETEKNGSSRKKSSKKKTVKTPKSQVDMSLRGAAKEDYTEEERDSSSAKKYVSKLKRKGANGFTSPSDLSKVSTVAMSPRSEGSNEEEADGLMTQENVAYQAADSADDNLASAEDDFPAGDDEEDDLAPPELPQDSSNDEDEKVESNSFDNNDDYDDHDEGPGFNMVHDPETPLTVREDRAKKEVARLREERRKKNRENGIESESEDNKDDAEEDSKTPEVKRSKKNKKKNNRRVVFSPKGIPTGNREYETVPIGALIEGSPDDDGPRRSRRAKFKPLQFWRGEKLQYGAHEERGYIGKAFGDMPIVTGVQKALPTPYKKRKQVTKKSAPTKGSRKKNSDDDSAEDEEYNSRKLRRKYKYNDGEEALLWHDILEENNDQSKICVLYVLLSHSVL